MVLPIKPEPPIKAKDFNLIFFSVSKNHTTVKYIIN